MRPSPAPARSSRLAGAAGALLLQGGFLFLFLYSLPQFSRPIEAGREMIYDLRRPPPPPVPSPLPGALPLPGPAPVRPAPALPPAPALTAPFAPALPDISGFGQALNDCAPEKYYNLRPEQKARCPKPGADSIFTGNMAAPHSLVKDEAHWETEFAHERSSLLLPCASAYGDAVGINLYCLGILAAKGTLTDRDNWPVYQTGANGY